MSDRFAATAPRPPRRPAALRRGKREQKTAQSSRPAWEETYPRFPKLLIVLAGKPSSRLNNRIRDLRAHCQVNKRLRPLTSALAAGATTLEQLAGQGPFAPIVTPLLLPDPVPGDARMRGAT